MARKFTLQFYFILFISFYSSLNLQSQSYKTLVSGPNHDVIVYEAPDDILYITANIPYNGTYAKGRAFTKFGAGNNGQYKKPIILVEGLDLDIGENHDQGDRIGDRGWPSFIAETTDENDPTERVFEKS